MYEKLINQKVRHQNTYMSSFGNTYNFLVNPWIPTMWAFIFPGFGHLFAGMFLEGYILMIWEIIVNTFAHINEGMMYSFQGKFDLAKKVINPNWALMYMAVYIFSAWDAYRSNVDTNNIYHLAKKEKSTIQPMVITGVSMVYLEKYKPKIVACWSLLMPGLGQLILHRMPSGFFIFTWWMTICLKSKFYLALCYTITGSFTKTITILNPQWFLYLPSIYLFAIYEAYFASVELNKIFKLEQSMYFTKEYQNKNFRLPVKKRKMY